MTLNPLGGPSFDATSCIRCVFHAASTHLGAFVWARAFSSPVMCEEIGTEGREMGLSADSSEDIVPSG